MSARRMPLVPVLAAAFSLCLLGALLAAEDLAAPTPPAAPAATPAAAPEAVMVEAVGLAPMPAGSALADVNREALLDARRNAVIQAHVMVLAQDLVQGSRLQESVVRSLALGYVEQMEVWESGPVTGSQPPMYRVRVHALVKPLQTFSAQAALGQNRRDAWQPALTLTMEGNAGARDLDQARATLTDALHRCGLAVQEHNGAPALALHMTVTADPKSGRSVVAEWELSVGAVASGTAERATGGVYVGHWQVDTEGGGADSWRRMGLMIAQDAIRLWNTPRWTTFRFLNPTPAQAEALTRSLGQAADARVSLADDLSVLTVGMPIAGDPAVGGGRLRAEGPPVSPGGARRVVPHPTDLQMPARAAPGGPGRRHVSRSPCRLAHEGQPR